MTRFKYRKNKNIIGESNMIYAYVTVKIPEELAAEIDRILENRTLGFRSRAELVNQAIRKLLLELEQRGGRND